MTLSNLNYFTFNGKKSYEFNAAVVGKDIYKGAVRDVRIVSVNGRSGDVILDNGRYKNVNVSYDIAAMIYDYTDGTKSEKNLIAITRDIKSHLLSNVGYYKLTDSYDPTFFRMAAYTDAFDIEQDSKFYGTSKITFNCKPFKYSKAGYLSHTYIAPFTLENPFAFDAEPYIKIYGYGGVNLIFNNEYTNETVYRIELIDDYIEIDSADMVVFKGNTLQNGKFQDERFPVIGKGSTQITFEGSVSAIEIAPRWRCL